MKTNLNETLILIILVLFFSSLMAFRSDDTPPAINKEEYTDPDEMKALAFEVLKTKCNVCHRKQNPFMVFNQRNMVNRAKRINQAVFIEKRMPKGNEIKLTQEESYILKQWLNTQNLK